MHIQQLSFVAAHISRIALGTGVFVIGYRNPVLLAQSLTTIDVLSGGLESKAPDSSD